MKNLIKFLLFLVYTILIFAIKNYLALGIIACINIGIAIIEKVNIKGIFVNLAKLFIFIAFTIIINWIAESLNYAILIGIKLILICNATYIYSKTLSYMEFAEVIEKIFYHLKIFNIDSKEIGIIICVALAFIPILNKERKQIVDVLRVKGFKLSIINILKNISTISKPCFLSILKRVNELENSLIIKGYEA